MEFTLRYSQFQEFSATTLAKILQLEKNFGRYLRPAWSVTAYLDSQIQIPILIPIPILSL